MSRRPGGRFHSLVMRWSGVASCCAVLAATVVLVPNRAAADPRRSIADGILQIVATSPDIGLATGSLTLEQDHDVIPRAEDIYKNRADNGTEDTFAGFFVVRSRITETHLMFRDGKWKEDGDKLDIRLRYRDQDGFSWVLTINGTITRPPFFALGLQPQFTGTFTLQGIVFTDVRGTVTGLLH